MTDTWWLNLCKAIDAQAYENALARQQQLTKPAGSLGQLETLAVQLAGLQGRVKPSVDQVWIAIFAGDHGVVAEGVSAYPQAVTGQMLLNFVSGGAAISVLARQLDAQLEVVDLGTVTPSLDLPGVRHLKRPINDHLWKGKPYAKLTFAKVGHGKGGRNNTGRITMRHRGGGVRRRIRTVDFKRDEPGKHIVERIEYDPNRYWRAWGVWWILVCWRQRLLSVETACRSRWCLWELRCTMLAARRTRARCSAVALVRTPQSLRRTR
ncbi:MAG: hypothetical protein EOP02_34170, partial [Proteobacteria bacterium]